LARERPGGEQRQIQHHQLVPQPGWFVRHAAHPIDKQVSYGEEMMDAGNDQGNVVGLTQDNPPLNRRPDECNGATEVDRPDALPPFLLGIRQDGCNHVEG
jgi:hypothetical protein